MGKTAVDRGEALAQIHFSSQSKVSAWNSSAMIGVIQRAQRTDFVDPHRLPL